MTLADLAAIGSFVSGVAVLVSLAFLYFQLKQIGLQVRQAERNQQAAIRQGRVARIVESSVAAVEPSAAVAISMGMNGAADLTATQLFQFNTHSISRLVNAEDAYYQYRDGLLNEAAYQGFVKQMRSMLRFVGMRVFYRRYRPSLGEEFVAFMDAIVAEVPVAPPVDAVAQWNADIVAEKAGTLP